MSPGLFAAEAVAPGWFDPTSYSNEAWFDEDIALEDGPGSAQSPAPLPSLGMVLDYRPILAADAGSYALTGVAASLGATRLLNASAGSYALSGVAAALTYGEIVEPITISETRYGLFADEAVSPGWFEPFAYSDAAWFDDEIAYRFSVGAPAFLPHLSTLFEERTGITASAGSYTYTGVSAVLRATRYVAESAGSYTLTGGAATLSRTSVNSSRNAAPLPSLGMVLDYSNILTAGAGSYAISGSAALKAGHLLTAATTSYSWAGSDASLVKVSAGGSPQYPAPLPHIGLIMAPGSTSNSVDYPASLPSLSSIMGRADGTFAMNGSPGIYTWTGQAAQFAHGYKITADAGSFVTDFSRVARDHQVTCNATSYAVSGSAAAIGRHFTLTCSAGAFVTTGQDAAFRLEAAGVYVLNGLLGTFAWEGFDASFAGGTRVLPADAGSYAFTGASASYLLNGVAPAAPVSPGGGRRRKHYVEIEGKYYEVRDHEHAVEILTELQQKAAAVIKKAQKPPKAKVFKPSSDTFAQDLKAQVDATNAILAQMYAQAQEEAELEELISLGVL